MINNSFIKSGFPLCKKYPILCVRGDYTVIPVYNRYDLYTTVLCNTIKSCYGVWIGKKNTDCFTIDPKEYTKKLPPESHKDIDSADHIKVITERNGTFVELYYSYPGGSVPIRCCLPELFEYIIEMGLPHLTEFSQ